MQWLITLETDRDMIVTCRLMNTFRRKGLKLVTLAMASRPTEFSMMAVVESSEAEVEHVFNLLRRTGGVQHVTWYRHEYSEKASFVFVDTEGENSSVARILAAFPESKLIFATHGKYLLEVPVEGRRRWVTRSLGKPEFLPFARVKTTRTVLQPELVVAPAS